MKNRYLVRPDDFSIFELDESNGCYRSLDSSSDPNRPTAMSHFTFENLTVNYGFFPIEADELDKYEKLCTEHYKFLSRQARPDGHGGVKGDTYDKLEFEKLCVKYGISFTYESHNPFYVLTEVLNSKNINVRETIPYNKYFKKSLFNNNRWL